QAEDGIRDLYVTGVQTCALPIFDFALAPVPTVRVSGLVQGPPDGYAGLTLRLMSPGSEELGAGAETATSLVGPSGTFTFLNVPKIGRASCRESGWRAGGGGAGGW